MLPQIMIFVTKHWLLCSAFALAAICVVIDEMISQGETGGKITSSRAILLMNREEAIVIDLRDANAFREGHIINARNYPLAEFDRYQEKLEMHRDRAIILVDAMGVKTALIAKRLKKAGFHHVVTLKGGMDAWKADSMPLVKK